MAVRRGIGWECRGLFAERGWDVNRQYRAGRLNLASAGHGGLRQVSQEDLAKAHLTETDL
jgi:hypothetical protein